MPTKFQNIAAQIIASIETEISLARIEEEVTKEAEGKSVEERLHRLEVESRAMMESVINLAQSLLVTKEKIEDSEANGFVFSTNFIAHLFGRATGLTITTGDVDTFMHAYLERDHSELGDEPDMKTQGADLAEQFVNWLYEQKGARFPRYE